MSENGTDGECAVDGQDDVAGETKCSRAENVSVEKDDRGADKGHGDGPENLGYDEGLRDVSLEFCTGAKM